jgi:hypothetical protein
MLDLVLFLSIDIYFVFHPSSNWFSFQFHTLFLFFFFKLSTIIFIIISFIFLIEFFSRFIPHCLILFDFNTKLIIIFSILVFKPNPKVDPG